MNIDPREPTSRDRIPVKDGWSDSVVLTDVLEHISPYYVGRIASEINRVPNGGDLLVITSNIV